MKNFINISDLSSKELRTIIEEAKSRKLNRKNLNKSAPDADKPFEGKSMAMIFEKPSTRTRMSFDIAVKQLGGSSIILNPDGIHYGKGDETLKDTAKVLTEYVDIVMLRTSSHKNLEEFGKHLDIPIIKDSPGVGQNLRDHPQVPVSWKIKDSFDNLSEKSKRGVTVALRYTASNSKLSNDMFIHQTAFSFPRMYWGGETTDSFVGMSACLYLQESMGELKLRTKDPNIQPYINFKFLNTKEDLRRMRECVRLCAEVGSGPEYSEIIAERFQPSDEQLSNDDLLDLWLKQNARSSAHLSSTCKMGPSSDPLSVVNQYGKVHGIEGLRVADASILPNCPRANTNVPTMMIGEKISEFIANGY